MPLLASAWLFSCRIDFLFRGIQFSEGPPQTTEGRPGRSPPHAPAFPVGATRQVALSETRMTSTFS